MKFFKGSRNETRRKKVKIRSVYFILGLLIGMAVSMSSKLYAYDENGEAVCLAKNIYFEAGNQPLAGKVAVAQVVLNRMEHASYPKDVCGVVYQAKWRENWKGQQVPIRHQCQFSWFCDGKSDEPLDTDTFLNRISLHQMFLWVSILTSLKVQLIIIQ